jgi:hypothetical protein
MLAFGLAAGFVLALVMFNRASRRRESEGVWDKEGFGTDPHRGSGTEYRRLEVPPAPPFD